MGRRRPAFIPWLALNSRSTPVLCCLPQICAEVKHPGAEHRPAPPWHWSSISVSVCARHPAPTYQAGLRISKIGFKLNVIRHADMATAVMEEEVCSTAHRPTEGGSRRKCGQDPPLWFPLERTGRAGSAGLGLARVHNFRSLCY